MNTNTIISESAKTNTAILIKSVIGSDNASTIMWGISLGREYPPNDEIFISVLNEIDSQENL